MGSQNAEQGCYLSFGMATKATINNSFYDHYGENWYTSYDDPVALLRAENKVKLPWILNKLQVVYPEKARILDVACGGGFLANELARQGYEVTGVDISPRSLEVASYHDTTKTVSYKVADAYALPFEDEAFEVVAAMDFLEHVDCPQDIIKECARVLKPGGMFFFHTFNRNPLAHLVVIKLPEWFIKNTPENMHINDLFIKPQEIRKYCHQNGLEVMSMTGIRPKFSTITWEMVKSGIVAKELEFALTKSHLLSYMGLARKL
jgi:2-polyprenyl-6-hydroxyphenyl methylase/3-demethylubiquinone-9 3-methyltransferase